MRRPCRLRFRGIGGDRRRVMQPASRDRARIGVGKAPCRDGPADRSLRRPEGGGKGRRTGRGCRAETGGAVAALKRRRRRRPNIRDIAVETTHGCRSFQKNAARYGAEGIEDRSRNGCAVLVYKIHIYDICSFNKNIDSIKRTKRDFGGEPVASTGAKPLRLSARLLPRLGSGPVRNRLPRGLCWG